MQGTRLVGSNNNGKSLLRLVTNAAVTDHCYGFHPLPTKLPQASWSLIPQPFTHLKCVGGLLALLCLWTGQPEALYPHQSTACEAAEVGDKWGFPLPVRFQWFPQAWRQNLVQYRPWFHSWQEGTSTSNAPCLNHLQRSPHLLLWIYSFWVQLSEPCLLRWIFTQQPWYRSGFGFNISSWSSLY